MVFNAPYLENEQGDPLLLFFLKPTEVDLYDLESQTLYS